MSCSVLFLIQKKSGRAILLFRLKYSKCGYLLRNVFEIFDLHF